MRTRELCNVEAYRSRGFQFVVTSIADGHWTAPGWRRETQFNLLLWFVCLHAARRAGWYAMPRGYLLPGAQTVQEMTHGCAILFSHWLKARELGTALIRQPGSQSCLESLKGVWKVIFRKLTRAKESEQWKMGPRQGSEVGCLRVGNCWKLGRKLTKRLE